MFRDTEPHGVVDDNVSVAVVGEFADLHLAGDNRKCLTSDASKKTVEEFVQVEL